MAEEEGDDFLRSRNIDWNGFENFNNFTALIAETAERADHFFELDFERGR